MSAYWQAAGDTCSHSETADIVFEDLSGPAPEVSYDLFWVCDAGEVVETIVRFDVLESFSFSAIQFTFTVTHPLAPLERTYGSVNSTWYPSFGGAFGFQGQAPDTVVLYTEPIDGFVCGDGVVDPGEQCDDGNTDDGDCCSSTCQFEADGAPCGDIGADCVYQDTCDGSGGCTDNGYWASGTPCTDDGDECTDDECNATGTCTHPDNQLCGACCLSNGTCIDDMLESTCNAQPGNFQGPGTRCLGTQACCFDDDTCQDMDAICCENEGGIPQGAGSKCGGMEACCLDDDTCVMADALCCLNELGGAPQGPGTACTPLEACCFTQGRCPCEDLDPLCCADAGGTPKGPGSRCLGVDANHNGIDDACELGTIPAVSEWGLVVLALLLLTGAKVYLGRQRGAAA